MLTNRGKYRVERGGGGKKKVNSRFDQQIYYRRKHFRRLDQRRMTPGGMAEWRMNTLGNQPRSAPSFTHGCSVSVSRCFFSFSFLASGFFLFFASDETE
jgi:hypothetical protein